jgi:hypothetical protein
MAASVAAAVSIFQLLPLGQQRHGGRQAVLSRQDRPAAAAQHAGRP